MHANKYGKTTHRQFYVNNNLMGNQLVFSYWYIIDNDANGLNNFFSKYIRLSRHIVLTKKAKIKNIKAKPVKFFDVIFIQLCISKFTLV